jgi:phosphate transport system permease protein
VASQVETLPAGGPAIPARPLSVSRARTGRRHLADRLARRLVTLGGVAIIGSILAILVVIADQAYPLFLPPTATPVRSLAGAPTLTLASPPLALGVDEYREVGFAVTAAGVQLFRVADGVAISTPALTGLNGATVVSVSAPGRDAFVLGLSDGRVLPVEVKFTAGFTEGRRHVTAEVVAGDGLVASPDGRPVRKVANAVAPGGPITVAAVGRGELAVLAVRERKALIGPATREATRGTLTVPIQGEIADLLLDGRGEDLYVATTGGQVVRVDVRDAGDPRVAETIVPGEPGAAVTRLGFLIGDRTLVVGDAAGRLSSWQLVRAGSQEPRLRRIHDFAPHPAPIVGFAASRRDKGFVTLDAAGGLHLGYGTTGATLLTLQADRGDGPALAFGPKADGILVADGTGRLLHWDVHNPHPEVTWRSLFGPVWYEGYEAPEYVWQSTGGTDDFESKLSLTPLIYGTLKGTFYALVFAIPVALLGALYTSQFMHPTLRAWVKPAVEVMAALPSVVLGFIAGLWLAPTIERYVPGLFVMPPIVAGCVLAAAVAWRLVPGPTRKRCPAGTEVFLAIPVVLLAGWLALALGGWLEQGLLGGDYRGWLREALGLTYDQRNSLVVGFAMGFAVIPIIFTIAEDSLSNVPQHLTAGSLALGANLWQTAIRIVLPTASPGIFSAVMIGFGRAVGETMIVLMATGNTPVMDWSIFNGFRALSANVAVELPEAAEFGTLYRVLFLAALLLFCMTFAVNTVAELVRLRLRQKYRYL